MADKIAQFRGTIYEDGYGLIAKKIMKDTNITLGAKALYAYICSYAGTSGKAFPGRELILHELGISKDTFSKYKNELVEHGYLAITQEKDNGKFKHHVYEITNSPCPKISDTIKPDTEISDTTNSDIINNSLKNNNNTINNIYNDVEEVGQNEDKCPDAINEVWNYYTDKLKAIGKTRKKTANKTQHINARLKDNFTTDQLKQVIDNVFSNDFMLGKNDNNKMYIEIDNFMCNTEKVEKWLEIIKPKDIQISKFDNHNTFDFGGM